jgi:hypothetical protein
MLEKARIISNNDHCIIKCGIQEGKFNIDRMKRKELPGVSSKLRKKRKKCFALECKND